MLKDAGFCHGHGEFRLIITTSRIIKCVGFRPAAVVIALGMVYALNYAKRFPSYQLPVTFKSLSRTHRLGISMLNRILVTSGDRLASFCFELMRNLLAGVSNQSDSEPRLLLSVSYSRMILILI